MHTVASPRIERSNLRITKITDSFWRNDQWNGIFLFLNLSSIRWLAKRSVFDQIESSVVLGHPLMELGNGGWYEVKLCFGIYLLIHRGGIARWSFLSPGFLPRVSNDTHGEKIYLGRKGKWNNPREKKFLERKEWKCNFCNLRKVFVFQLTTDFYLWIETQSRARVQFTFIDIFF